MIANLSMIRSKKYYIEREESNSGLMFPIYTCASGRRHKTVILPCRCRHVGDIMASYNPI